MNAAEGHLGDYGHRGNEGRRGNEASAYAAPTVWTIARRPRWIAALVYVLVLAAGFASLSQWQLARSFSSGTVRSADTEVPVPLSDLAQPQQPVTAASAGQMVSVSGSWVASDYVLLRDRLNRDHTGWWVVGHVVTTGKASLAVAVGWAPSQRAAESARARLSSLQPGPVQSITGRYYPSEGADSGDLTRGHPATLAPAALINVWQQPDAAGTFAGYLVATEPAAGLSAVYSPRPTTDVEVNLLNIFYAIEWVIFAGFALFLWFRLVQDAREREIDEEAERHASATGLADLSSALSAAPRTRSPHPDEISANTAHLS